MATLHPWWASVKSAARARVDSLPRALRPSRDREVLVALVAVDVDQDVARVAPRASLKVVEARVVAVAVALDVARARVVVGVRAQVVVEVVVGVSKCNRGT